MGYLSPLIVPFLVGLGSALLFTPVCRRLALRLDIVDRPGGRKIHGEPTPLLGGLAIAAAAVAGVVAAGRLDPLLQRILLASGGIVLLGAYDDKHPSAPGLRWWLRLLFEACLAMLVLDAGVR